MSALKPRYEPYKTYLQITLIILAYLAFRLLTFPFWLIYKLFTGARYIYKEWWLSFYFWLNEHYLGGPDYAGEWVKTSHIIRLITNALKILLYIAAIVLPGILLPLWAIIPVSLLLLMTINTAAMFVGAPSNTVKIQVYYNTEWELQLLNNELGHIEQEPPHGILHSHFSQQMMLAKRYLHDINSVGGSGISILLICADALAVLGITVLLSTGMGALLSLIALISGVASAVFITYTYKNRLAVHTQNINDQINLYYDRIEDNGAQKIIDHIFLEHPIKKDKYYEWIKFRCYKAVHRALQEGAAIDESVIKSSLENLKIERNILDALPLFEEQLYQKLKSKSDAPLNELYELFTPAQNKYRDAFIHYFKSAWLGYYPDFKIIENYSKETWRDLLQTNLNNYVDIINQTAHFNIENLKNEQEWAVDTSHGKRLLTTVHIKKCAQLFAERCALNSLKTKPTDIIEQKAFDIWYDVVPKKPDGEYDYDDHEPLFHGVMTFAMKYLIEELKREVDQFVLKNKLRNVISEITEESAVKKFFGFSYKSFNLKKLESSTTPYRTPWLTESSAVYSALRA